MRLRYGQGPRAGSNREPVVFGDLIARVRSGRGLAGAGSANPEPRIIFQPPRNDLDLGRFVARSFRSPKS